GPRPLAPAGLRARPVAAPTGVGPPPHPRPPGRPLVSHHHRGARAAPSDLIPPNAGPAFGGAAGVPPVVPGGYRPHGPPPPGAPPGAMRRARGYGPARAGRHPGPDRPRGAAPAAPSLSPPAGPVTDAPRGPELGQRGDPCRSQPQRGGQGSPPGDRCITLTHLQIDTLGEGV